MIKERQPTGMHVGTDRVSFMDVHRVFSATPEGQTLSTKVRYDRYRPSHISERQWVKLLGVDVDNLRHMPLTLGLARTFLHYCDNATTKPEQATFSLEEKEQILLAATIHDWGESIIPDITVDKKTLEDEEREAVVIQDLVSQLELKHNPQALREKMDKAHRQVFAPNVKQTKLGMAFNAIERLGYLRTGLIAWDRSEYSEIVGDDAVLTESLQWLTNNVLLNQIPNLLSYSNVYPPVAVFLARNSSRISHAFETMPDDVFSRYEAEDQEKYRAKYELAQAHWQESNFVNRS